MADMVSRQWKTGAGRKTKEVWTVVPVTRVSTRTTTLETVSGADVQKSAKLVVQDRHYYYLCISTRAWTDLAAKILGTDLEF